MAQFEAITAHRAISSESLITDAHQAINGVLGEGAVDFSTANGGGVDLLGEEELAVMHKMTSALGGLSIAQLAQTAAAFLPESFKNGANTALYLPQIITVAGLEGERREFVLALSNRKRLRNERQAFTDAFDRITGENLPWQKPITGLKLGEIAEGLTIQKPELEEIKRRIPASRVRLKRGTAKKTKVTAV